jgi:hypothetical protein
MGAWRQLYQHVLFHKIGSNCFRNHEKKKIHDSLVMGYPFHHHSNFSLVFLRASHIRVY